MSLIQPTTQVERGAFWIVMRGHDVAKSGGAHLVSSSVTRFVSGMVVALGCLGSWHCL